MRILKSILSLLLAANLLPAADDPAYTEQPITLIAVADGNPAPTYEWFKNNIKVSDGDRIVFSAIKLSDAGTYKVKASNPVGSAESTEYILTVIESTIPVFAVQPQDQIITFSSSSSSSSSSSGGSLVIFSSSANGTPTPTYQWYKNGVLIDGATNANLTISNASSSDVASYFVEAKNFRGTTRSNTVTLTTQTISAPVFAEQPQNQTVNPGQVINLSSMANGNPTYQWFKNEVAIPGATANDYSISIAKESDAGYYYVVATNSAGSTTSSLAQVIVNSAPTIIAQPFNQSIKLGDPVVFTVTANGTSLQYQWRKNGVNIVGANNSTYTILAVTKGDSASYDVVVSNTLGVVASNKATLNVLYAPIFIQQPTRLVTLSLNSTLRLNAVVDGSPTPNLLWQKVGSVFSAEGPELLINNVQLSDAGTYNLLASNDLGSIKSADSTVVIGSAPVIKTPLANITARKFSTVTFTISVEGATPLQYQWRKNGRLISGANSATLTLRNVNNPDSATYSVLVSNSYGSVTSNASLRVTN